MTKGLSVCWLLLLAMAVGGSGSPVEKEAGTDLIPHGSTRAFTHRQRSTMAYTTLLYGDDFLLGVRVLGKSIRDTGTAKDMVALVSKGVSPEAMNLLEADGWIVVPIELLANPNSKRPARFWGVYTKLKIFNMTNYKKVVFLDADTIVTRSIEDLFECQKFCANLKHSERLNSGVMVVEPSEALFDDMLSKMGTLRSYTGGDQGFLNSYYEDFANARLFNPDMSPEERQAYTPEMERLSTLYNADVGLFVLANKWMVEKDSDLRVVHYTLGPLKPWDWWTHWLVTPVDYWQDIRVTLPASLPGTGAGQTPRTRLVVKLMFLLPLVILAFINRRLLCQIHHDLCSLFYNVSCAQARVLWYKYTAGSPLPMYSTVTRSTPNTPPQQYTNGAGGAVGNTRMPGYLGSLSIVVSLGSLLLSLALSIMMIPNQVMPWTGMILAYEWTFFLYFLLLGKYLDLVHGYGRKSSAQSYPASPSSDDFPQYNSDKGHAHQGVLWDMDTLFYTLGIVVLAIAVPSVPFVLQVTSLFGRVGLMAAVGIIFAVFLTHASEHLAIRCYLNGRDEGNPLRLSSTS